ncbi:MAG: cell division protein FtsH, partial [Deltaproteobacteria bacterium]
KARQILEENIDILHKLSELLIEKETVLGKELDDLIYEMRPGITIPGITPSSDTSSDTSPDTKTAKPTESKE